MRDKPRTINDKNHGPASSPMAGATDLTRTELEALLSIVIASIALPRDGWRRRDAGRAVAAIRAWARELSDWCYYVPERDGKRT